MHLKRGDYMIEKGVGNNVNNYNFLTGYTKWNNATKLSRNGGGYIIVESNDIVDCSINLKGMG